MLLGSSPLITQVFAEQLLRSNYNNNNFKGTVQRLKKLHTLGRRSQVNCKLFVKAGWGKKTSGKRSFLERNSQSEREEGCGEVTWGGNT